MVLTIVPGENEEHLGKAVELYLRARHVAALTGAGISVESGIPDFRSPGGVWTIYDPQEYATLEVFLRDPAKAWMLYRELGKGLVGKKPNAAHIALARLEAAGLLEGVITQNVDGLHQAAGSRNVLEIHGDHHHLQCLQCGWLGPLEQGHLEGEDVPSCPRCGYPLKPNMVLFGEDVRHMGEIQELMARCDLLLVIGTSAQVYPAAGLPVQVARSGGLIFEMNLEPTHLTRGRTLYQGFLGGRAQSDVVFRGPATVTVPLLAEEVLRRGA